MTTPTKTNPVIFIRGLWIHSAAWAPWIDLFESHCYSASAPGWPGDGPTVAATRENSDALTDMGIPQMVDHYAQLIGTPEIKPVVVGHSFGGLIAQELLANGVVAAAVAIDPASKCAPDHRPREVMARALVHDSGDETDAHPETAQQDRGGDHRPPWVARSGGEQRQR
jgi:pimeloyl-ACP methyl ester carboxylesterase